MELVEKFVWYFYGIFYPFYLFSLPGTIGGLKLLEQDVQDTVNKAGEQEQFIPYLNRDK